MAMSTWQLSSHDPPLLCLLTQTVHAGEEGFDLPGHCSVCYSVRFGMVYLLES